jgi:hypothetical protein
MLRNLLLVSGLFTLPAGAVLADEPAPTEAEVRQAVAKSLPFLEKQGVAWMNERGCASCHTVTFLLWSHNEAKRRGIAVDARKLEEWTNWTLVNTLTRGKEGGGLDTMSQLILGRDLASSWRDRPERYQKTVDPFETVWGFILERQKPDGSWPVEGQLRTPPEISTMWALLALASRDTKEIAADRGAGGPLAGLLKKIDEELPKSRDRALAFLKQTKPEDSTESLLLRMQVARRFGEAGRADELRKEALARQNADGGWSNRHEVTESEAFTTGQALYALGNEGLGGDDPAVRRAWQFLVRTQREDGSWLVTTNSVRPKTNGQKADFAYTFWGSAWGAIGLARTLPEVKATARKSE